jgi:Homeodomain-like domain
MTTTTWSSPTVAPRVHLTTRQHACLEQMVRRQTSPQRLVRRAKMLWALETGATACQVARPMHRNRGTVRTWHQRWRALAPKREQCAAEGGRATVLRTMIVETWTDPPRPGPPATFTAEQSIQSVAVACEDPADAGRPVSHWPPREVAEAVRNRGAVETIRTRSVGRFLQSGRLTAASAGAGGSHLAHATRPRRAP